VTAKRILVIEGDDEIRDLLREVLVEEGYAVVTAATALDALAATVRGLPDLVVLDLRLPLMDGGTIIREHLAALGGDPRVIVVTASGDTEAVASGADAVVTKPFNIDDLTAVVASILSREPRRSALARSAGVPQATPGC
jgi:DNA-binding response OmpR family regulator